MSILGTGLLKLVTSDDVAYSINYTFNRKFDFADEDLEHKSDIDGERIFDEKGDHAVFSCHVNLFKNTNVRDAWSVLRELYKTNVYIYPYTSYSIKDADGDDVYFFFKKMFWYNLETADYKDALYLEFHSTKYVDVFASSSATLLWPEGTDIDWPDGEPVEV